MRRALDGGYELDDDRDRLDVTSVVEFLTTQAYWGRWRGEAEIRAQLASAWRVVAAYDAGGAQVGFARAVSDGVAFGYLADVFVQPSARGRGLGLAIVRELVEGAGAEQFRWMLHTADAHGLYAKLGFAPPDRTVLERPAPQHAAGVVAGR